MDGDDDEEGTEYKYPKETLKCALDANCNNGLEVRALCLVGMRWCAHHAAMGAPSAL